MNARKILPLTLSALAVGATPAIASSPFVAYDLGGGETDFEVAVRSLDGSASGKSFGPAEGKYSRGPSSPRFSPDGRRLLFGGHHHLDRDAQSLWVRTVDGKRTTEVPLELSKHGILRGWDWSPNGKRVVFSATRNGVSEVATVYTVKLDGSGLRKVAKGQYPTWGAGRISFERPGSVHVVKADGTGARRLATVKGQYRTEATISPDGGTVLYTKSFKTAPEWHRVDVATGDDEVIKTQDTAPGSASYAPPKFTPDGEHLISAKYQPPVLTAGKEVEESYRVVLMDTDAANEQAFLQFGENEPYGRFPDLDLQPE